MSLDLSKLEKVRELAGGIVQARCPACAEGGHDGKGGHLRIYPDGRYGCCVFPKDKGHLKRIFALAGDKRPRGQFRVRVCGKLAALGGGWSVKAALADYLGTLGTPKSAGTLGTGETGSKSGAAMIGTLGTPKTESENAVPGVPSSPADYFGTLGTPIFKSRARTRGNTPIGVDGSVEQLKDLETAVPSVPSGEREAQPPEGARSQEPLPYLTPGGTLVIPFDAAERYHWWKLDGERLHVWETRAEVLRRIEQGKDDHGTGV